MSTTETYRKDKKKELLIRVKHNYLLDYYIKDIDIIIWLIKQIETREKEVDRIISDPNAEVSDLEKIQQEMLSIIM